MAKEHARAARRLNLRAKKGTGTLSGEDIAAVLAIWGEQCFYCLKDLTYGFTGNGSFDHLVPYASGGLNVKKNLVPCCKTCNNEKGEKWVYLSLARTRLVFRHRKPTDDLKKWRW